MAHKGHIEKRLDELIEMRDRHIAWIEAFDHVECLSSSDALDIGQWLAFVHRERALARILQEQVDCVCRALQRMQEGADSRCEDCGDTISDGRRRILPEATRCVPCQERWEQLNGDGRHR